jgi:hypothetical protein
LPWLGAWLCFFSVLAACADFLGIEERKQDTAANYPVEGYAGCRPGQCGGCLDVHRRECEARTACANAEGHDDCAGCVCENCEDSVVDCQLDPGCSAIWQCLRDTRCDLSERATGNCAEACGEVIRDSGGLNGRSFQKAVEIRTCAAGAACLTCLAPQVQQSTRVCSQATACQECDTCFDQCLCSGEQFGECRELCKEAGDSPPAACSVEDGCAGCTSCNHSCLCNGGTFEVCNASCTQDTTPPDTTPPDPPASCTDANSCVGCPDCVSQCVCSGAGTQMECGTLCNPPSDSCVEDPRGQNSSCGGCESCVAEYTCGGSTIEDAVNLNCGATDCCQNPNNCGGGSGAGENSFSYCTCGGSSTACFEAYFGSCDDYGPCEHSACEACPGELGMCWDTPGCTQTFDCMRSTNCKGRGCLDRCRSSGYPPESFAIAEALWACYKGSGAGCDTPPPDPIQCTTPAGMAECAGYVGINVTLYPCCNEQVNIYAQTTGVEQNVPDDNPCGLELYRYYRDARSCEPRTQQNPPRFDLLETCPDAVPPGAPYYGAILQGCCRGADHTCGYFDDITGLGCLSASVFGDTPQPCPTTTGAP